MVPGFVGVAVKVTLLPKHICPAGFAAIETLTGLAGKQGVPGIFAHQVPHRPGSVTPEGVDAYSCTVQKSSPVGSVIVAV